MIDTAFENKISSTEKNIKKDINKITEDIITINTTHDQKLNDFKNNILKEISLKDDIYNQNFAYIPQKREIQNLENIKS